MNDYSTPQAQVISFDNDYVVAMSSTGSASQTNGFVSILSEFRDK